MDVFFDLHVRINAFQLVLVNICMIYISSHKPGLVLNFYNFNICKSYFLACVLQTQIALLTRPALPGREGILDHRGPDILPLVESDPARKGREIHLHSEPPDRR